MLKTILKERTLVILTLLAVIIRLFSDNSLAVEDYYSTGIYPPIASFLRVLFGWLPFSIGDLLYISIVFYLVYKGAHFFFGSKVRQWKLYLSWIQLRKFLLLCLYIYIVFNVLWGLNYNRQGIARHLGLKVDVYNTKDLSTLTRLLQQRLNQTADKIDTVERLTFNSNQKLLDEGVRAYAVARDSFPFLRYAHPSVKPSMVSHIAQYFGFTGYYNPFTGEAQLKTTVPVFLKPFILTHEMAHQLGYAKENEANFVGYLACKNAHEPNFQYSAYFELTLYALTELRARDSLVAKTFRTSWSPRVRNDYNELVAYFRSTENPIEPIIMRFYGQYLKMNSQPKGNKTYNEVIAWLIAYMKKYGEQAI